MITFGNNSLAQGLKIVGGSLDSESLCMLGNEKCQFQVPRECNGQDIDVLLCGG
jgi:hypothetical protein